MKNDVKAIEELSQIIEPVLIDRCVSFPETSWGERRFTPLMAAMVFGDVVIDDGIVFECPPMLWPVEMPEIIEAA